MKSNKDYYQYIIEKVMKTTYDEFIEQIRYLLRYSHNGPIHIIHEYFDDYIEDIKKKTVEELTDNEKLILMVHWAYKNGEIDKYRETPFSIIEQLTDAEVVKEFNRRCNDPLYHVRIESHATCSEDF